LLGVVVTAIGYAYYQLSGSLAQLDGEVRLVGLAGPVTVERDALGVPTIRATTRLDATRALGYVHSQERFFQMDLLRRRAAGELSELFGGLAVEADKRARLHRFRDVARRALEAIPPEYRAHAAAYTEGVNAGLQALRSVPFEYHLLRLEPKRWEAEDSLLPIYAMFLTLQTGRYEEESLLGVMHDRLPPALFDFLAPTGTEWDAPLVGAAVTQPPIPPPDVLDLREAATVPPAMPSGTAAGLSVRTSAVVSADVWPGLAGSNNWAVAGSLTSHGGALLADDMHLGLTVPNTWYRASIVWPSDGAERRVTGVTLPGTPSVVVGSNGAVAWGFTNSQGDWIDLVEIETAGSTEGTYLTPDGPQPFDAHVETIRVRDAPDVHLTIRSTVWGPLVDKDHQGRPRALRWTAHDPEAVNFELLRMERVRNVEEALAVGAVAGVPPQNLVCADVDGQIGWTLLGRIPRRVGRVGRRPQSWASGEHGWAGWLRPEEYPRILSPADGVLWTANGRAVDGEALEKIGHGGYALGSRAAQIRDGLRALQPPVSEQDLLDLQLDDRALFLQRWRDLLLEALEETGTTQSPRRAQLRPFVEAWGGRAAIDSVGYRAVRSFRREVARLSLPPLLAGCCDADVRADYLRWFRQQEGPLWSLVNDRPAHLLAPGFEDWHALFEAAAEATFETLLEDGPELSERTWGEANSTQISHPMSRAVPFLARWLDMPHEPLPGDDHMPRVQHAANGASERLVVSPGHEEQGLFHMPGGQSGHPLSPFYANGHAAWSRGDATPFLPGPVTHTLTLLP
jgi:penicillin amidase